jgi:hypothetical protein
MVNGTKEIEIEHLLLMLLGAYLVYHFFLRRCPKCGHMVYQCKSLGCNCGSKGCPNGCGKGCSKGIGKGFGKGCSKIFEGFTPLDTIHTSLDDSINNPSCCISNTAGYSIDPIAINGSAPGYATNSAYANPCN